MTAMNLSESSFLNVKLTTKDLQQSQGVTHLSLCTSLVEPTKEQSVSTDLSQSVQVLACLQMTTISSNKIYIRVHCITWGSRDKAFVPVARPA